MASAPFIAMEEIGWPSTMSTVFNGGQGSHPTLMGTLPVVGPPHAAVKSEINGLDVAGHVRGFIGRPNIGATWIAICVRLSSTARLHHHRQPASPTSSLARSASPLACSSSAILQLPPVSNPSPACNHESPLASTDRSRRGRGRYRPSAPRCRPPAALPSIVIPPVVGKSMVGRGVAAMALVGIGLIGVGSKNPETTMLSLRSPIATDRSRGERLWLARARMSSLRGLLSCSSACGFYGSAVALTLPSIRGASIVGSGFDRRCAMAAVSNEGGGAPLGAPMPLK
ncbi:hypothetical protein ACLOJK_028222 [Asimina triloba]